ncbi:alpha/beta hydrolase [Ponticoccus sp. SC2-23]|uniref:alpha/beta fold hydrolase n=1 Tax=Alexandriicola marinus TaxID=2081710 RepID=UPI000FD9656A|nr:alpha/beta hydrolase [Alexandriicola marinus]MBM1220891.1 alpha/beta hydrolase [Ponticoccus sp. SC6-9]MBM1225461.1 alpha/beta hydrolase [Ponticoccus sp. SC6-15]MBM1227644.1 alpha/beta hydrolase [Ponticoccus sp. SC6-38]MBM1234718.1 alpha/beta hydrolase [Ponticoccus sp. SC6-45]MBM1238146.1 alpha/beta hydrolase [Ponticoccus sp. SC6-49]MBM1244221.1 alpha/beta hydrolase [Ponticoccus sp. SC2-64]MBM1248242.1 alpha/beta hydrolase [Ponticoccus sp. SC6-42]MBM1252546.1 alpha/beta hydrolase [Pontico
MPTLQTDGAELHYETGGSGPPLLLLAGMFSDSASWGPVVAPLEAQFTVIRPDNRTTGRTRHAGAARVEDMARDAAALLEELALGPAHIVGHSLGGALALMIADERPGLVRSVLLSCTAPLPRPHLVALFDGLCRIRAAAGSDWLRALYPWLFAPPFFEEPRNVEAAMLAAGAYPHAQSLTAMQAQVAAFAAFDPMALRPVTGLPTRAVFAGEDLIVPDALARARLAELGVADAVTIPGAGHSLHWEAPEAFVSEILQFLGPKTDLQRLRS